MIARRDGIVTKKNRSNLFRLLNIDSEEKREKFRKLTTLSGVDKENKQYPVKKGNNHGDAGIGTD